MLVIHVAVKFRVFGVDIGTARDTFSFPLTLETRTLANLIVNQLKYSRQGFTITAEIVNG